MNVDLPALGSPSTCGDNQFLACFQQLTHDFLGVPLGNHGADRHLDTQILALAPGAVAALAAATVFCPVQALVAEVDQGVQIRIGHQHDIAAVPAVTAVRPAPGDVLLAPEAHTTAAAATGLHPDTGLVDELHGSI